MNEYIKKIIERNKKVEADKAWETSKTRKVIIALITYIFASLFLLVIWIKDPFLNALIPTIWFLFSTLSIRFVKQWWIKRVYKNKK